MCACVGVGVTVCALGVVVVVVELVMRADIANMKLHVDFTDVCMSVCVGGSALNACACLCERVCMMQTCGCGCTMCAREGV